MNGKQGDDPVTDVVDYGVRVFSVEADQLIVEIDELGGWNSLLARAFMLDVHASWRELKDRDPDRAEAVLRNVERMLREELERLRS